MKLSIIVPIYNEIDNIKQVIERILESNYEKEIIIVDDGSEDGTRDFLKREIEGRYNNIKVLYHENNQGKTAAIRTATPQITGDIVIIQDGDMEYNPADYKRLIRPFKYDKADVVYGSRFIYINRYLFFWYWFLNKFIRKHYEIRYLSNFLGIQFLNYLAFMLYRVKVTDIATGYKVFKADLFKNIRLDYNRFEFCYEITAKIAKRHLRLKEVAIDYHPRSNIKGKKITWKDGIWAALALIKCRFKK